MMEQKFGVAVNYLYRILNAGVLACFILFATGTVWGIKEPSVGHLLMVCLVIVVLTGIFHLKLRGRTLLICGVVGGLLIAVMVMGLNESLRFAGNYINWLTNGTSWKEEWIGLYEVIQAGLISILGYFIEGVAERYSLFRKVSGGIILLWLAFQLFSDNAVSHSCVIFALCYCLIVYVEMVQSRWKKTKSGGIKAYMLWIMPFIIAFTVMMGIFPAPKKPYDWKFVKDAYHHIAEGLTMFSYNFLQADGEDFGMTMSGFSEDGDLRGGITDSDKEVMTVKGQTGLMTNVYLTGKVFDAFDGREWIAENESTEEERLLDTLETIYAVNCYESEHFRNYVYSTTIQIRYRYIKTGYLFAPLKTFTVWDRNSKLPFHEQGGNFVLDEKAGYGTGYDVQYYQMNVDHPEFYHFLEAERSEDEGVWKDLKKRYKYSDNSVIDRADMEVHKQKIYEHYLHDVTLSDDVKDYLSEVTTGAETDVERLKAIERALSGFTYSKQIGELPETVNNQEEFLDYFLLESKEGYCTYFATAFVLLAWEEGIPARYVQGFCVPIKKDEEKAVSSAMAHAWPEVYIDDVGWIPFEPTPGYDRIRYTPWEMQAGTESDENLVAGAGAGTHYWEEDNQPETVTEVQELEKLPEQEDGTGELFGTILLYTVLLVLLVCLIMLVVDGLVGRYRYKRQSLLEKYRIQVNKNLQILAMLGYERRAAETLQEFGGRAVWAMDDDVSQETLLFIGYYEELLYGKREVKEELLSVIANSRKLLLAELKKQKKRAYPIYMIKLYLNRKNML